MRARKRLDLHHTHGLQADDRTRHLPTPLFSFIPSPLPRDQLPAEPKQRRGVLDQHGERSHGPGSDEVKRLRSSELLHALWQNFDVREAGRPTQPISNGSMPLLRLEQNEVRSGQRDGQGKAREARPGADIGHPSRRRAQMRQDGQRIRHVLVGGVYHRRGRIRLSRKGSEQRCEGRRIKRVRSGYLKQPFHVLLDGAYDQAAVRLVALGMRLHIRAIREVVVHHLALVRAHRLQLYGAPEVERI